MTTTTERRLSRLESRHNDERVTLPGVPEGFTMGDLRELLRRIDGKSLGLPLEQVKGQAP